MNSYVTLITYLVIYGLIFFGLYKLIKFIIKKIKQTESKHDDELIKKFMEAQNKK